MKTKQFSAIIHIRCRPGSPGNRLCGACDLRASLPVSACLLWNPAGISAANGLSASARRAAGTSPLGHQCACGGASTTGADGFANGCSNATSSAGRGGPGRSRPGLLLGAGILELERRLDLDRRALGDSAVARRHLGGRRMGKARTPLGLARRTLALAPSTDGNDHTTGRMVMSGASAPRVTE